MQKIKDYIYYNRKEIIICLISILLFMSYIFITKNEQEIYIEKGNEILKEKEEEINEENNEKIIVDIKGEVKNPGTYELEKDSRVIDAINKSGGLTDNAYTNDINLSEKVYDEMIIIISSKEEEKEITKNEDTKIITNKQNNKKDTDGKISINNATVEELMQIKGIGETKAKKIVEYRNNNGKFKTLEELTNVSGIGKKTFEKIKDFIKL